MSTPCPFGGRPHDEHYVTFADPLAARLWCEGKFDEAWSVSESPEGRERAQREFENARNAQSAAQSEDK